MKRIKRDTLERYDIWVVQAFPHDGFLTEQLRICQGMGVQLKVEEAAYLFNLFLVPGGDPKLFDANFLADGSPTRVTEPTIRE